MKIRTQLSESKPNTPSAAPHCGKAKPVMLLFFPFQVIQTSEQVIALAAESDLAGTQVFLKLPDAQGSQGRTELVTVAVEDLLDKRVTLICEEAK